MLRVTSAGSGAPGNSRTSHHPTYLDSGCILLFDNGAHRRGVNHSRVIEVDPKTNAVTWEYRGDPRISFYSYNISGAERLPNGNTLISEGAPGRIFEVTLLGEMVWEYINPFTVQRSSGILQGTEAGVTGSAAPVLRENTEWWNGVFRAHRYGHDHSAVRERDLDPSRHANLNRLLFSYA